MTGVQTCALPILRSMAGPRELGNLTLAAENARREWGWTALESTWKDLCHGIRMLRKHKAFTAVAVFSLAVGIGANTAVFSVIDALMLKELPVKDPDRLVIFRVPVREGNAGVSYPALEQLRVRAKSFSGIVGHGEPSSARVSEGNEQSFELVRLDQVSANFFSVFGVNAVLGRTFPEDSEPSETQVVISYGFWQRKLGMDANGIGKAIRLNGRPATIIGVAPQGFRGIDVARDTDLWMQLERVVVVNPQLREPNTAWLTLFARLGPEQSIERAQAEMDVLFSQMSSEGAPERRYFRLGETRLELKSSAAGWTPLRERFAQQLKILMGMVAFLLLIACANVSGLLLARGAARRKEIAVRLAIGGGRSRLVRQLLVESASLAGVAALGGLVFAYWATRLLLRYVAQQADSSLIAGLDARALLFTTGISILTVALFALLPALTTTKLDITPTIKDHTPEYGRRRRGFTLNRSNVVFQVALSLMLLVGAGLLLRTLRNLRTFDAGFDRENVLQFSINPGPGLTRPQVIAIHAEMLPRVAALHGVTSATYSANAMLAPATRQGSFSSVEGYVPAPNERIVAQWFFVGPKFFETVGLPLIMGRGITEADENSKVVVINESLSKKYFAGRNPIGRHLDSYEIVGVARDAKYHTLREETPVALYAPFSPTASPINAFFLRTTGDRSSLPAAIRQIAKEINPRILVSDLRTMAEVADATIVQERLIAQVSGFFSSLALFLAAIGLFGLLSYNVSQRTKEIGIRMALGARSREVIGMVLSETVLVVGIGLAFGACGVFVLSRYISNLLFEVSPTDAMTILIAGLVLIGAAALAGYFPARRATRVDPLTALRYE